MTPQSAIVFLSARQTAPKTRSTWQASTFRPFATRTRTYIRRTRRATMLALHVEQQGGREAGRRGSAAGMLCDTSETNVESGNLKCITSSEGLTGVSRTVTACAISMRRKRHRCPNYIVLLTLNGAQPVPHAWRSLFPEILTFPEFRTLTITFLNN